MNGEIDRTSESQVQVELLGHSIAELLGIDFGSVELKNPEDFLNGSRYLHGFSNLPDGMGGFIKATSIPENKERLRREVSDVLGESGIGVREVKVLGGYQETTGGIGVIHLERMDIENGTILATSELIAAEEPIYGVLAAETIFHLSGREIPKHPDSLLLKRDDYRNASAVSFWSCWKNQTDIVMDPKFDEIRGPLADREVLNKIVTEAEQTLRPFINDSSTEGKEYFVHNDMSPGNMFFPKDCLMRPIPGIFLDFEYAGAVKNRLLALMTDLGNYYGRLWPNPSMQQEYLPALLKIPLDDDRLGLDLETRYNLVKSIAVFGAMALSKFAMDPNHREHSMTKSLLRNLIPNLTQLEKEYQYSKN